MTLPSQYKQQEIQAIAKFNHILLTFSSYMHNILCILSIVCVPVAIVNVSCSILLQDDLRPHIRWVFKGL